MSLPLIIDVATLQDALDSAASKASAPIKVLDLRAADVFAAGHIRGAKHIDSRLLGRAEAPFAGLLPDDAGIRALISAADLRTDDHIVAVDAGRATEAARLIWVLHAWGFDATSWLDGGMNAWIDEGGELTTDPKPDAAADARPHHEPALVADNKASADELHAELDDAAVRVLDVRGPAEFAGTDVRSAEGGHVPGAKHLVWTDQLQENGRLHDIEQLRAQLKALDVLPEHRVVAYCQSHQRSSVTWLVLRSLGYENVRGLDGAWSVWGNRPELPKER